MPATYEPIATFTVSTGGTTTINFTSIPQTYTDIVYVSYTPSISGVNTNMTFNGDASALYSCTQLYAESGFATPGTFRLTGSTYMLSGISDGTASMSGHIMNYSNTTTTKNMIARGGGSGRYNDIDINLYRSTSAITSIQFLAYNWAVGSTVSIYGIKAA
jgi:hypothetical protein